MKPSQKPNARKPKRAICDCGARTEVYHNTNWICARCASIENHRVNKDSMPRDRSVRIEITEHRVTIDYIP